MHFFFNAINMRKNTKIKGRRQRAGAEIHVAIKVWIPNKNIFDLSTSALQRYIHIHGSPLPKKLPQIIVILILQIIVHIIQCIRQQSGKLTHGE